MNIKALQQFTDEVFNHWATLGRLTDAQNHEASLMNEICQLARYKYDDNAIEALVGVLSTVVTTAQLEALCARWSQ
jgi:hypothetical protein